jgi:hypothetical protein
MDRKLQGIEMKIDFDLARQILEEEADQIRTIQVSGYWV